MQLEAGEDSAALQLQACLRKSAATHQVLIGHAKKHSITIPDAEEEEEEEMDGPDDFYWPQYIAVGAKDWKEDMKGVLCPSRLQQHTQGFEAWMNWIIAVQPRNLWRSCHLRAAC